MEDTLLTDWSRAQFALTIMQEYHQNLVILFLLNLTLKFPIVITLDT